MTPDQEAQLLETVTAVNVKMNLLISDDAARGIVPDLKVRQAVLEKAVDDNIKDWVFWKGYIKGGLAVIAALFLALGGVLAAHLLGGK
jgi:hypothetical protein